MKRLHILFVIIYFLILALVSYSFYAYGGVDSKTEYLIPVGLAILILIHLSLWHSKAIGVTERMFVRLTLINLLFLLVLGILVFTQIFDALFCPKSDLYGLACGFMILGALVISGIIAAVSTILGVISVFKKSVPMPN